MENEEERMNRVSYTVKKKKKKKKMHNFFFFFFANSTIYLAFRG